MAIPRRGSGPMHYPESDGKPLAETETHLQQIFDLYASLRARFHDQPQVHVSSNLLLYYEEGNPASAVAPDIMVVCGIPPGQRRTFKLWEEGKAPDVVFEITSASSRLEDRGTKKATYAMLGVAEYYLFDPTGDYLKPPMRAYRLHGDDYLEVVERPLISPTLGLELRVVNGFLRLVDATSTDLLPIPDELVRQVQEEREARLAAEQQVRQAEERARQAETEVLRLRKLLEE